MHKSCIHIECMNHISNGLVQKMVEDIKIIFFFAQIWLVGKHSNCHIRVKQSAWDGCAMKECVAWECAVLGW